MSERPSSGTGGVQPFPIGGRLVNERERLRGMTKEERQWRAQYVRDQILSHNEPKYVDEFLQARLNPIRRMYRFPLDTLEKVLRGPLGEHRAFVTRYVTGKFFLGMAMVYSTYYYFKYNTHDWMRHGGWHVMVSRTKVLPDDPEFPKGPINKKPQDYGDRGFSKSPI